MRVAVLVFKTHVLNFRKPSVKLDFPSVAYEVFFFFRVFSHFKNHPGQMFSDTYFQRVGF